MAFIGFTCGWCKTPTSSHILDQKCTIDPEIRDLYEVQLLVECAQCGKFSLLEYSDFNGTYEGISFEEQSLNEVLEHRVNELGPFQETIDGQLPSLRRPCPSGISFIRSNEIATAWDDAERTFAVPSLSTPAGMAYRRVIDVAVKHMTSNKSKRMPLGQRLKSLSEDNKISEELISLIYEAKAFGDEAAHGEALTDNDAQIARDLCEAFLRQAFTVPYLIRKAKEAQEAKEIKKQPLI